MARQRTTDRRGHQCVGWKIVADVAKSLFVSQRFQELNDGSSARSLQVVLSCSVYTVSAVTPTGTSVVVEGQLLRTPEGTKQPVELKATRVLSVGPCDAGSYPIPKKRVNLKTLIFSFL